MQDGALERIQIFLHGDIVLTGTPEHLCGITFHIFSRNKNEAAQH